MPRLTSQRIVLLIFVVVVLIALVVPVSFTVADRVHIAWWDFLHVPAFAFLIAAGLSIAPKRWLLMIGMIIVLVPVVEFIQGYTGREFSRVDMYLGWIGVGVGCFWWLQRKLHIKALAIVPMLGLVAAGLWHPLAVMMDRRNMQRAFPVLVGFDTGWVPSRWQISGCTIEKQDEAWFARIASDGGYPGMFLDDLPSDWSRAERWEIEVELIDVEIAEMWVRLDDRLNPVYHDRFQEMHRLTSGVHRIEIPRARFALATGGRPIDLHRVQTVGIFFTNAKSGTIFRIKRMELRLMNP